MQATEDIVNINKILRVFSLNIITIISSLVISIAVAILLYSQSERLFEIRSLIKVDPDKNAESILSEQSLFTSSRSNLGEVSVLYKSRTNIVSLIKASNLNFSVDNNNILDFQDSDYFDEIFLTNEDNLSVEDLKKIDLDITLQLSENSFFVLDLNTKKAKETKYNEGVEVGFGYKLYVIRDTNDKNYTNKDISLISSQNIDFLIDRYSANFIVSPYNSRNPFGTLLMIRTITSNPDRAIALQNKLNNIYSLNSIDAKSKQASSSIEFINERIEEVNIDIELKESRINDFRERNLYFDQGAEGQSLSLKLDDLRSQLGAKEIEEVRVASQYPKESSIYKNFIAQKNIIVENIEEVEEKINRLPEIEQDFLKLNNDLIATRSVLGNLIDKRIEYSIIEASTISDVEQIEEPHIVKLVSPLVQNFVLVALLVWIFAISIYLVIKTRYIDRIKYPSELIERFKDNNLLGLIPKFDDNGLEKNSANADMVSSIVANLTLKMNELSSKVVLVTGATKGVGKSTTCVLLAGELASQGSRTLIVDCDYRQGDLHSRYNVQRLKNNNFRDFLENTDNFKVKDGFYLFPRISGIESSIGFFGSKDFESLFLELSKGFDYVIIDTPPLLSVSDALILSKYASERIIVCNHKQTKLHEVSNVVNIFESAGWDENLNLIYNSFERHASLYGYYEYSSYKYSYDSTYYYGKDD